MPVRDSEELLAVLSSGSFDQLKGTPEAQWVEFKKEPYLFTIPKGVWEWSKDVAALANAGGGLIVVGVSRDRSPEQQLDVAGDQALVPKHLVDVRKHMDLLRANVFPEPRGVRLSWYPPEGDRGLLLVEVPRQDERDLPFVVRNMLDVNGKVTVALGVPTRVDADTSWLSAERLHPILNRDRERGLGGESPESWAVVRRARMDQRIEQLERECGWTDVPCLFLQAAPPRSMGMLPTLHEPDGIRGALERPNAMRHMGFHIFPGGVPEPRDGGLTVLSSSRKALWLDRDGMLTAGGVVTEKWFGRSREENREAPVLINSLVLTEYTLEFFRFVYNALAPTVPSGAWTFRVVARRLHGRSRAVQLAPGRHDSYFGFPSPSDASAAEFTEEFIGVGDAGYDAFTALRLVYGYFGLSRSDIPFSQGDTVVENEIRAIR